MGQRPLVSPHDRVSGQRLRQGVARGIVLSIALGDGPLHHRADALAHAACGFGLVMPDRGEYRQHVGRGHLGHGERAKMRMCVLLQRSSPLRGVLGVAPAGAVQRQDLRGSLFEGRHAPCVAALGEGITAGPRELAVAQGYVPRFGQRDDGAAAEPERPGGAADDEPLYPTPRAGGVDLQIQAVAVAVAPGLRHGSDERGGESIVRMPAAGFGASRLLLVYIHTIFYLQLMLGTKRTSWTRMGREEPTRSFLLRIITRRSLAALGPYGKAKVGGLSLRHLVTLTYLLSVVYVYHKEDWSPT